MKTNEFNYCNISSCGQEFLLIDRTDLIYYLKDDDLNKFDDNVLEKMGFTKDYLVKEKYNVIAFKKDNLTLSRYYNTENRYWLTFNGRIISFIISDVNQFNYLISRLAS